MKALTIHQPYASWIIDGAKWVENRTWATGYRGPLAIHAGLSQVELRRLHCQGTYPRGVILGHVQLVACETLERMRELAAGLTLGCRLPCEEPHVSRSIIELLEHNHTWGPVCWILENPVRFAKPIPARGRQGLWEWEEAA
jgi:activating signal cointegrator 1